MVVSASLLTTKLYRPPVRPERVMRPRLLGRPSVGLTRPLTLISAPAGFGKTTLVSERLACAHTARTEGWIAVPGAVMLAFWSLAVVGWQASGYVQPLITFGYIGTSIGVGLGLYATLPKRHKPIGRRLTLFLVGAFLFGFAVLLGHENAQLIEETKDHLKCKPF